MVNPLCGNHAPQRLGDPYDDAKTSGGCGRQCAVRSRFGRELGQRRCRLGQSPSKRGLLRRRRPDHRRQHPPGRRPDPGQRRDPQPAAEEDRRRTRTPWLCDRASQHARPAQDRQQGSPAPYEPRQRRRMRDHAGPGQAVAASRRGRLPRHRPGDTLRRQTCLKIHKVARHPPHFGGGFLFPYYIVRHSYILTVCTPCLHLNQIFYNTLK